MDCLTKTKNNGLTLSVYVQPRASNNRIAGLHGKAIKVCVTAPPLDDKANTAVIHFFADLFGIQRSAVSIKSGRQARNKKVLLNNLALEKAAEVLARAVPKT
jgi:uncharacterized protein (TIGR00251 family)